MVRQGMLAALLRFINERQGTVFEPRGRYPTGEQGAFAIAERTNSGERRFVLKWEPGTTPDRPRAAAAVTERLRAAGYPAPRYRLIGVAPPLGVVYSVQEALPGRPLAGHLDRALLDRLLELNALQRDRAPAASDDWPRAVVEPVLHGGDGFCLLDPMRAYSTTTAALLDKVQRLAARGAGERAPTGDVVHFDFQGANILVDHDELSGVVDWEGCCAGDAAFDLATLYFYADDDGSASDQRDRLWRMLVARTAPPLLGAYLAHLILRQVDWSIRFHDAATVDRWRGRADDVLRRLASATVDGTGRRRSGRARGGTAAETTVGGGPRARPSERRRDGRAAAD